MALKGIRGLILLTTFLLQMSVKAQVVIVPEVQADGVVMKQQLWTCLIQNASASTLQAVLVVTISDRLNSQVLSETSSALLQIPQGLKRFSFQEQSPMIFGVSSLGFAADRPMNQPLPVGEYQVCYRLVDQGAKKQILATECIRVVSEPLSPPQLIQPENGTTVVDARPAFSWTPPAPIQQFNTLEYEMRLVVVFNGQSPAEALQRNIPVVSTFHASNAMAFPSSYSNLEQGKTYAWQVQALDAGRSGGFSEVWTFSIMPDSVVQRIESAPYVMIGEKQTSPAIIHQRFVKLAYNHRGPEQLVTLRVRPVSGSRKRVGFETKQRIIPGQNFFQLNLNGKMKLDEGEVYELELVDQSKQVKRLQFQTFNYF